MKDKQTTPKYKNIFEPIRIGLGYIMLVAAGMMSGVLIGTQATVPASELATGINVILFAILGLWIIAMTLELYIDYRAAKLAKEAATA